MLLQSMLLKRPWAEAIKQTDKVFGMNKKKKLLESEFQD
jgi:glyceraldehyde-3-phosphate dehydrogenase (NAD(P))